MGLRISVVVSSHALFRNFLPPSPTLSIDRIPGPFFAIDADFHRGDFLPDPKLELVISNHKPLFNLSALLAS